MKNLIKLNFLIILIGLFYFAACDTGVQSTGNSIHGNITFVDTNFAIQNGNYAVALYKYQESAFSFSPVSLQNISISSSKTANYTINNDGGGYYYLAVVWVKNSNVNNSNPTILGVHGCDTTHNCNNEIAIAFPNYTGHNFDIVSWADTTMRLY